MPGPFMHIPAAFCTPLAAIGDGGSDRVWLVIAFVMLVASYLLMRPKRKKDPLNQPLSVSLAQQRHVEREMQNLLVELTQMAQQISAQLDTRAAKLEALIKEADEKITQLRPTAPSPSLPQSPIAPAESQTAIDPRYVEIYSMADHGRAVREIADKLNRPTGEIELILALRGRNSASRHGLEPVPESNDRATTGFSAPA